MIAKLLYIELQAIAPQSLPHPGGFFYAQKAKGTKMTKKFGLTKKGLVIPRYADFLEMMIESYEADTGVKVNREPGDALYSLFVVYARQDDEEMQMLQAVYDQQDPNNAEGVQLDNLCNISGIRRHRASTSTAGLELTGDPGVTVPDGKRIEDANGLWWLVMDAKPFDATGKATAYAIATEMGPHGPTDLNAKVHIVNPVFGWSDVKFTSISRGRYQETDPELRRRRELSMQIRGTGSCKAIRARLLALPFIKAAVVLENDTNYPKTVGGIPNVPPHSVVPVIYSDETDGKLIGSDRIKNVARILYEHVVAGVKCYGIDQSGTVIGEDGGTKLIQWTYAENVPVTVEVQVTGVNPATVVDEIKASVRLYLETVQVGDPVRRLPIVVAAGKIAGITDVTVLLNGVDADISVSETQVGIVFDGDISVT